MYKGLYDIFAHWYNKDRGTIFLYSDPHFGKRKEITDDEQVRRINSVVHKYDTIIFLGDIGNEDIIAKINGYKVLITGNHDRGATKYKKRIFMIDESEIEALKKYSPDGKVFRDEITNILYYDTNRFDEVYTGPLMINNKVLLSHEPIPMPPYMFNIHGHRHDLPYKYDDFHLNLCAENINYTPVKFTDLIKNGTFSKIDEIHWHIINFKNK